MKGKLGKLFDTIETQVRNLKYLGNEHDRYGPFLIPVITSKIPDDLNLISSRKFDSADSCVIEIALNALKTKVTAEEKSVFQNKLKICEMSYSRYSTIRKNGKFRVYFVKSHIKARIQSSWTSGQEKNIVRRGNLFCVCLKGCHLTKDCCSKIKCFKCSKCHHLVLCDLEESSQS